LSERVARIEALRDCSNGKKYDIINGDDVVGTARPNAARAGNRGGMVMVPYGENLDIFVHSK
jgi:hypothetical protein